MSGWNQKYIGLAKYVSQWSKDPSTKVGAVIVDNQNRVVSIGYNGFPREVCDNEERYNDRQQKYLMVVHAEQNAIYNSSQDLTGCKIYITHPPCSSCMGAIIQSGIDRVYCIKPDMEILDRHKDSIHAASIMSNEATVPITYVEVKNVE